MKIIFIGGINGSGKTTVAKKFLRKKNFLVLHGTTELMKILKIPINNYELLQKTNIRKTKKAMIQLFLNLSTFSSYIKKKNIIITGHYVKIFNGKITPFFGRWYKYCNLLIMLYSSPSIILDRIEKDEINKERNRKIFASHFSDRKKKELFLKKAQNISFKIMAKASEEFKIPYYLLKNNDGKIQKTVKCIKNIINDINEI